MAIAFSLCRIPLLVNYLILRSISVFPYPYEASIACLDDFPRVVTHMGIKGCAAYIERVAFWQLHIRHSHNV